MKIKTLIIILFIISYSCNRPATNNFVLSGTIDGDAPEIIYLTYGKKKDSCKVVNKSFKFKGCVASPTRAQFNIYPANTQDYPLYIENSSMTVKIKVDKKPHNGIDVNFIKLENVTGSKTAEIQKNYLKFYANYNSNKEDNPKLYSKIRTIIKNNPKNVFSGDLLSDIANEEFFNRKKLLSLYSILDTSKQSKTSLETITKKLFPETHVQIGDKMIDFILPNKDNILVQTKNYRNSYLFIDFWASWCAPCRKQSPELLKTYKIYKTKGFEILGVSIDQNKEQWLKAIEKDQLTWQNVIDTYGVDSNILNAYDATTSIPVNYLINKEGIVIKNNITTTELKEFLKNEFKSD
ncbi:TlpA disulfide reductase family protein [Cellulophaga lytica]|uniref:TlpA disulfide reductase family protein n=1 Tax=Cellulophaga lytica TaxID=979 RepID=UPI0026E2BA1C|nr:TlpA disulfide reductase family protein [Cellulophaga lytica]MDO6853628.1 TlpA disulfide reductase family protein [Cellulophaga lytica]